MRKVCEWCGREYEGRHDSKYCSDKCRKEKSVAWQRAWRKKNPDYDRTWYRKRHNLVEKERQCVICGATFKTYNNMKLTCSPECAKANRRRGAEIRAKNMAARGDYDKTITLKKLITRDSGICHICGKPVDEEDYKSGPGYKQVGSMYPSIDHIVPISKGGTHTWGNVKLAHVGCNRKKGNR